MRRRSPLLLSGAVAAACGPMVARAAGPVSPLALSSLRIGVDNIDTEPINGFIPQVVLGLTNEQDSDEEYSGVEGFGIQSGSPGGSGLPVSGAVPQYVIATLDTGSSASIVSYDAAQTFDLDGAGLTGTKTATISGASGDEDVAITNALGTYATDFGHATAGAGGRLTVAAGALRGQYNVPILEADQGDGLPNILGSPILSQYRVTIQNSQPQHLTVGGVTSQTPRVTLGAFSSTIPAGYAKLTLKPFDSSSQSAETEDTPYYLNYDLTGPTNPDTPGVWASLFTNGGVSLTRNGTTATNQTFLVDTGAQVSVISNDMAASLGIFNASPANADFTVQAQGVGGVTTVPGYYVNNLSLLTQGGVLTWSRVPVIVLDVADPRDPSSALPGILGTNLFTDRDLVLNTNVDATGQSYMAIGPQMQWNSSSGGTWGNANNWAVVLPNGIDMQANFYGAITAPATINVDGAETVGRITFDNANRYTLAGAGSVTLDDSTDAAQINVRTGSHTIAVPVTLASDTQVTVIPATSTLTVSGVISSTGGQGITVSGLGTLLLSAANTYTGGTNVSSGTLTVTGSIAGSVNVSTAAGATLNAAGGVNAGLGRSTVLDSGGATNIGPNPAASGTAAVVLASVEVGSDPTSKVTLLAAASPANRLVLVTGGLTFDSTSAGQLDLANNDLILRGGNLATATGEVAQGFARGTWNGSGGIVSSAAAANARHLTAIGVIQNATRIGGTTPIYTTFDGQPVAAADVLARYTYYGDANLDGVVNAADYTRIDAGFVMHLTGWQNGDFNYDGVVDGSDYTLMDNAFNQQSGGIAAPAVEPATPTVAAAAVPEPLSLAPTLAALSLVARRRRRRGTRAAIGQH